MPTTTEPVPFPTELPPGYAWLPDEPTFDPERHLALSEPDHVVTLRDLGYGDDEIVAAATPMAISAPFRVLSEDGARVMLSVARRLRVFARPAGNRIERSVRGGVYRSRWLRDLCRSPDVAEHLSAIYGVDVTAHPMAGQLGHLNFEPSEIDRAVDKWHHDTLPLDYVMAVTDLAAVPGGRFEYFVGTKAEAAELRAAGRTPPPDLVRAPDFPGPGAVVAMQGDMVVHRAAALTAAAERITMVNGYVTIDPPVNEQSRTADLIGVDDPATLYTEWARMAAWRSGQRLQRLVDGLAFGTDPVEAVTALRAAVADVERAIVDIEAGARPIEHYEG